MVLNIVVLDQEENFVRFLDPELCEIKEVQEDSKVKRITFTYFMQSLNDARKLFKLGYKLWISGDNNLDDCLYLISTSVKRDYFKENMVNFEAEEVLVELNYAPLFSQSDVTEANGFTINVINEEENVTVDYNALKFWFGDYFNIGIVQECLNAYVSRIVPTGTMTKMELLRFIEDETSNVFITRYEKDANTNVIHRYLDFLNPNNNDKSWELRFYHEFYPDQASADIALYDPDGNLIEEDEIVEGTDQVDLDPPQQIDIASCYFKLVDGDGTERFNEKATSLGFTTGLNDLECIIKYYHSVKRVNIIVKNTAYSTPSWTAEDGQNGTATPTTTTLDTTNIDVNNLSNNSVFTIYDANKVWYRRTINPQTGVTHHDVLDLGYNVENIEYEVDEEDTYTAISPVLDMKAATTSSTKLTKQQIDQVIEKWLNLEVNKGDTVPMIVQKVNMSEEPTDEFMAQVNISNKYYSRPVNPNDSNEQYEYWKASAYWLAPFSKRKGEMHVTDEGLTGIDYRNIFTRPDLQDRRCNSMVTPKMGTVSTSDEDPYAIFNDVCMKLKEKRYPDIKIDVDVANLINHEFNNYNIHDLVYIKVPGFEKLITAEVSKTEKQAHDLNKNKISLSNYSVNTKVAQKHTYIIGSNVAYTYPETSQLDVQLFDENDNVLSGKLITFQVYYNQSTFTSSYTRITDNNGAATLPLKLNPGNYLINIVFGGDNDYDGCEQSYYVNVGGTVEEQTAGEGETTSTETTYWSQYGVSPDGKKIMAIGRPSVGAENRYGYTFYKSTFTRKCPHCGSTELYWSIFWAGNETSNWGRFPATGRNEGGSAEGHIFCKKCDADYSCILGREHVSSGRSLTKLSGPEKVSKTEAYTLKKGQMVYEKKTTTTATQANTATRPEPIVSNIDATVKQKALSIVGASTGLDAAKKIAAWCGPNIKYVGYNNFQRSPATVLRNRGGNCCDQTRLMLTMMDAAGVARQYKLIYIHTVGGKGGHVFAKINGVYVDPCKANPWGNYVTGYGVPGSAPSSTYPALPF